MSKQLFADLVDVAVRLEKFGCDQFIVVHEGLLGKVRWFFVCFPLVLKLVYVFCCEQ